MTEVDVIWCEDCKFFGSADMGGEGWCDTKNTDTWYGNNAVDCPDFKPMLENEDRKAIEFWNRRAEA